MHMILFPLVKSTVFAGAEPIGLILWELEGMGNPEDYHLYLH